ncbi:MAG: hypothetical protein AAGA85_08375 [Bacteroidota bacterium]
MRRRTIIPVTLLLLSVTAFAQNNKEKERIRKCEDTKTDFISTNDRMADRFDEAYGYAIFPSVGKGGLGVGGAHGDGVLFKR